MITIFTDGASRGNPGPGGWAAIVAAYDRVAELGGREEATTNNRMELMGAIRALSFLDSLRGAEDAPDASGMRDEIIIHTDSSYLINGVTKWLPGWQRRGWKTSAKQDVLNRDLWEELAARIEGKKIVWRYVPGHAGVPGNMRVDEIATSLADKRAIKLYVGPLSGYSVDLSKMAEDTVLSKEEYDAKRNAKARSAAKAYSYVSMVDGIIETHTAWAECEARVKGKSKAKFKKALSKEEESAIIAEFKKAG